VFLPHTSIGVIIENFEKGLHSFMYKLQKFTIYIEQVSILALNKTSFYTDPIKELSPFLVVHGIMN
jgi:hypothetical protein